MPTLEGTLDYLERVSQRLYERLDRRDPDTGRTKKLDSRAWLPAMRLLAKAKFLRDTPFVLNLVLWIIEVIAIVYRLRPT